MKILNKILDNLNKYIKEDLVSWIVSNINYKVEYIDDFEIDIYSDLSEFYELRISFGILLNDRLITFHVRYDKQCQSYFLYIQNTPLNIKLRFIYSIENEKELFRIINTFSECFLNGHYIHDESYFYEGDNNE